MKLYPLLYEAVDLRRDVNSMSEEEYDEYFQVLLSKFWQSMAELDNYEPLEFLGRIQYDVIPKEDKENIKYWLHSKEKIEGPADKKHVDEIGRSGKIRMPVVLDLRTDHTVEGRHRLAAALKYNLDVPVLMVLT